MSNVPEDGAPDARPRRGCFGRPPHHGLNNVRTKSTQALLTYASRREIVLTAEKLELVEGVVSLLPFLSEQLQKSWDCRHVCGGDVQRDIEATIDVAILEFQATYTEGFEPSRVAILREVLRFRQGLAGRN